MIKNVFVLFIAILIFGCKLKPDQNLIFERYVQDLEDDFQFVFSKKDEKNFFLPIELLEKDSASILPKVFYKRTKKNIQFLPAELNEANQQKIQLIQTYVKHRFYFDKGVEDVQDTSRIFSIVEVLNSEAIDSTQSNDNQFLKIINRLEGIPLYFEEAKTKLKTPEKEKLQLAVSQYAKDYFFLKNQLPALIRKPAILKEDQLDFSNKNKNAQIAIKDFIAFLNSHLFEIRDKALKASMK